MRIFLLSFHLYKIEYKRIECKNKYCVYGKINGRRFIEEVKANNVAVEDKEAEIAEKRRCCIVR